MNDYTVTGDPQKDAINKARAQEAGNPNPATDLSSSVGLTQPNGFVRSMPLNAPATMPAAISTETLTGTQNPVRLPSTTPTTTAEGISGIASVIAEQNKAVKEQQAKAASAQAATDETKQSFTDTFKKIFNIQSSQTQLEADAKLPEKQLAVADATNKIEASQRAQTNELRALDGQGLTDVQKAQASREINRRYAFEQADLALIQSAANRDYETASNIVNRKIQLQLEPLQTQLQYLQFFYQDNKADLTKAEERAFTAKISQLDKQYTTAKDQLDKIGALRLKAIENGANVPASVWAQVDKAGTYEQALSILQANNVSLENPTDKAYKEAQTAKLRAEASPSGGVNITRLDANGNPLPPGPKEVALQTILGSGTFTKDQRTTITNAINNGQDAFSVIKNQAKNIMGQTLATDLSKTETAKSQLTAIDSLLRQYYADGGKTSIFTGKYEQVVNKLGEVKDPKLVSIATEIALAMQAYRLAVTGTAASVQEDARIDNVFPGINSSKGLNEARLNALLKSFDQKIDSDYRNVLGKSYDSLKQGDVASPETTKDDPLGLGFPSGTLANPLGI